VIAPMRERKAQVLHVVEEEETELVTTVEDLDI
jgi:hypothetical protein